MRLTKRELRRVIKEEVDEMFDWSGYLSGEMMGR